MGNFNLGFLSYELQNNTFSSYDKVIYESYKRFLDITQPGLVEAFIGGGFSGCIAAAVTTPFDVIKTHQQIEFGEKFLYSTNGGEKKKQMTTTLQTMRNIMRSNGVAGFYAGLVPRLFKVVIACAMMITSYEVGKTFFHGYNVQIYKEKHPEKLTLIPLVEENISQ